MNVNQMLKQESEYDGLWHTDTGSEGIVEINVTEY